MAVAACLAHTDLADVEQYADRLPPHVFTDLKLALQVQKQGGRQCDVCGKHFLIPRREWLEYRVVGPEGLDKLLAEEFEGFWPFLRRGCSPGCVRENGAPMAWLRPK
jgi:hypothetical protein